MSLPGQAAAGLAPRSTLDDSLDWVRAQAPVVDRVLGEHGDASIGDYLREALPTVTRAMQPRDDLAAVVEAYAGRLLGEAVGERLGGAIRETPLVLTANHHGVDFFAQSVQSSLILSLLAAARGTRGHGALVFACGGVPLDNFTYPMGLLIYGVRRATWESLPLRVAVFSNRYRRQLVSVAGPIDNAMTERTGKRVAALLQQGDVCDSLGPALEEILADYASAEVLAAPDYSQQAVLLNHRLWQRLFAEGASAPALTVLELETIVRELLDKDLGDERSLAWCTHFDPSVRRGLIRELDGARACWDEEALCRRHTMQDRRASSSAGTFLYWGITARGRRVPLWLEEREDGARLRGVDDNGAELAFEFDAEAIREHLAARRLLPSLFNCFLTVAFARGVNCVGAYYQAEYLPAMQRGLVAALDAAGAYEHAAQSIAAVPTDSYLAGMQAVMWRHDARALIAAGPAEIIAAGGLGNDDIERILSLSVREAHLASLMETVADLMPQQARSVEWRRRVAGECDRLLAGSVIVK